MFNKIINYLKESLVELKKISWLSWQETLNLTINIILFTITFVIIYWLFDLLLLRIIFIK
jgi:preprotein translocase SecE subunit